MTTDHATRRDFLRTTSAAALTLGALGAAAAPAAARLARRRDGGLKILVLGGTGFLGPAVVDAALARGHTITLFNRGKTEKRKGGLYPDLEKLYGNRDPDKHADEADPSSPKGLESLKGRAWDAVVDTSAYFPRIAAASANQLAQQNCGYYLFISTISVYADASKIGADESAPLAAIADPTVEDFGPSFENYGALKVLCEQAVERAFPAKSSIVRPGYIVGPNDPTDRFTYWPVRVSRAVGDRTEVLAPGAPDDPVQIVDARDLGEFVVACLESRVTGAYDATGPEKGHRMADLLDACQKAAATDPTFTWVPTEFLAQQGVLNTGEIPIWAPSQGEYAGFHTRNVSKAVRAGLKFRPLDDTIAATLAWFKSQPEERQNQLRAGPAPAREAEILKAWHAKG